MSTLTLTWKYDAPPTRDGSFIRPDRFSRLSVEQVKQWPVRVGRTDTTLDALCDVSGEPSDCVVLRDAPPLDRLGAQMTGGELRVEGDAGHDLGASMSGGVIRVAGNAGDRVGGPDVSQPRGMTGGTIAIEGNAGDHVGLRMRRGLIMVGGQCGASPGYRMLAGSLVIGRGPVDHAGLEMRRGTIICLYDDNPAVTGPNFSEATRDQPIAVSAMPAVAMLVRRAASLLNRKASNDAVDLSSARLRLWHGDRFELNRGEIIQCLS